MPPPKLNTTSTILFNCLCDGQLDLQKGLKKFQFSTWFRASTAKMTSFKSSLKTAQSFIKLRRRNFLRKYRYLLLATIALIVLFVYLDLSFTSSERSFDRLSSAATHPRSKTVARARGPVLGQNWLVHSNAEKGAQDRWRELLKRCQSYNPNVSTVDFQPRRVPEALSYGYWPDFREYPPVVERSLNGTYSGAEQLAPLVTIFTQSSVDRLHLLKSVSLSWSRGAISLAVYLENQQDMLDLGSHLQEFEEFRANNSKFNQAGVTFSLLFGAPLSEHLARFDGVNVQPNSDWTKYDLLYPINALRNVALKSVKTEWSFSLDLDFVPSSNSYSYLSKHLNGWTNFLGSGKRTLFVVPAFELSSPRIALLSTVEQRRRAAAELDLQFGPRMAKFYEWCRQGLLIPFHSKRVANVGPHNQAQIDSYCQGANVTAPHFRTTKVHALTNFTHWILSSSSRVLHTPVSNQTASIRQGIKKQPYLLPIGNRHLITGSSALKLSWENVNWTTLEKHFEPYWLGKTASIPLFDERFRGYSFNKRQHTIALQRAHCSFMVTPNVMIIHRPHDKSDSKQQLTSDKDIQQAVRRVFQEFLLEG